MGKCSYLNCKYGNCNCKDTCWTHQHTNNIFVWNKFMKMLKEAEESYESVEDPICEG